MIKCPHCGAMNSPGVVFCKTCQTNIHFKGQYRPSNPNESHPEKSHNVALMLIVLTVLAIYGIGYVLWLWSEWFKGIH